MYKILWCLCVVLISTKNSCHLTNLDACIYVAGHTGLAGEALVRALHRQGYTNVITRSHHVLDLEDRAAVAEFFTAHHPDYVFIAAAKVVSPSHADQHAVEIIDTNIRIVSNILAAAHNHHTQKVLLIGSIYAYPSMCEQPVTEDTLYTGTLDTTMHGYGLAKRTIIALCSAYNRQYNMPYVSVIPAIVYGPKDMQAQSEKPLIQIIKTVVEAYQLNSPTATIYDKPDTMRDYIHVDDFADACIAVMQTYNESQPLNVGSGYGITTRELSELIAQEVGYTGDLIYKSSPHYQMPAHVYDITLLNSIGVQPPISLKEGVRTLL